MLRSRIQDIVLTSQACGCGRGGVERTVVTGGAGPSRGGHTVNVTIHTRGTAKGSRTTLRTVLACIIERNWGYHHEKNTL